MKDIMGINHGQIAKWINEAIVKFTLSDLISDGYHTFKELYDTRRILNAALFNEWAKSNKYDVHKSVHHSDGEKCFGGGWFIVVAELPTGQISYHYELEHWHLFNIPERELPNTFDGHTSQDVLTRLSLL